VFRRDGVALSGRIFLDETVDASPEQLCARSGRTLRPRPAAAAPVEEPSRPTRRGAAGASAPGCGRCAAARKELDEAPTLHDQPGGAGSWSVSSTPTSAPARGNTAPAMTAEAGRCSPQRRTMPPPTPRPCAEPADRADWRCPARAATYRPRGIGELASVRYRGGSDDIDLDQTIEQLVEHPLPDEDDIIVQRADPYPRSVVAARRRIGLDAAVSGYAPGGDGWPLASELARDDLAVSPSGRRGCPRPPGPFSRDARLPTQCCGSAKDSRTSPSAGGCRPGAVARAGRDAGSCCCPTACTTPAPTPVRSRRGCAAGRSARPSGEHDAGLARDLAGSPRPACSGRRTTATSPSPEFRLRIRRYAMSVVVVATITPLPGHTSRRVTCCAPPSPPSTPRTVASCTRSTKRPTASSLVELGAAPTPGRTARERPSPKLHQALDGWLAGPAEWSCSTSVRPGDPAKGWVGHG